MESLLNMTEINRITNTTVFNINDNDINNQVFYNNSTNPAYTFDENFLNKLSIQIFLIIAYTFVFCCCFIGNSLVIAVLALNNEMHTTTNFFLLNLAIADLCVALFCVYQNLSLYLSSEWAFGDLLCRMYHFFHALSYTASVCILVVIAIERYLALVHPLWARRMLTMNKLRISIIIVWILSAVCCFPRFIIYGTITIPSGDNNQTETLCILKQRFYDPKLYDVIYITLCFVIPLIIITVLYLRICYHLWTSRMPGYSIDANRSHSNHHNNQISHISVNNNLSNISSVNILLKRRKKVIKLLVVVVLAFAIFGLPFHARKLIQHYVKSYNVSSKYASMFTIFTTLFLYMNSGINPLIYLMFSKKLRKMMIHLMLRILKLNKNDTGSDSQRVMTQNHQQNHELISRNTSKTTCV